MVHSVLWFPWAAKRKCLKVGRMEEVLSFTFILQMFGGLACLRPHVSSDAVLGIRDASHIPPHAFRVSGAAQGVSIVCKRIPQRATIRPSHGSLSLYLARKLRPVALFLRWNARSFPERELDLYRASGLALRSYEVNVWWRRTWF